MIHHRKTIDILPKRFIDARREKEPVTGVCADYDESCDHVLHDEGVGAVLKCWMLDPACGECPLLRGEGDE